MTDRDSSTRSVSVLVFCVWAGQGRETWRYDSRRLIRTVMIIRGGGERRMSRRIMITMGMVVVVVVVLKMGKIS